MKTFEAPERTSGSRFVVLHHKLPPDSNRADHWDLMLESGDHLKTWELLEPPSHTGHRIARQIDDHRKKYLQFEGDLSDNRGSVNRVMEGRYHRLDDSDWDREPFSIQLSVQQVIPAVDIGKTIEVQFRRQDHNTWYLSFTS